jgi:iron complex outermembrane receptor protein
MLKRTMLAKSLLIAFGGTAALYAGGAVAQDAPQELQRVTVTGSNIKRTDTETAAPVQILTRQDIERTGKQSIQEILRTISADGQGSIPSSFSNGFASGSAAVSLRGLGVNSTLVLINGRRMTSYPLADDGTRSFVDLNSIPLEAVEQVEVLKDGASAIYGSDAVGGVVNIILRKSYNGASIGGTLGGTQHGGGAAQRAFGTFGMGNLDTDKYNAFFTIEASHQAHIESSQRGFIGETDLRSRGFYDVTNGAPRYWLGATTPSTTSPYGVTRTPPAGSGTRVNILKCDPSLIDPNTGLCRYNGRVEQEVQPEVDRLNLYGRGTFQITPTLQAYTELGYFQTKSKANGTLGGNNDGGVFNPADPGNLVVHGLMTLPANHPDNTFGVDRTLALSPAELGGRDQKTDNRVFRIVQGLTGSAYGFDYEVGGTFARSVLSDTQTGYIRYDVMQAALNNGTYRISPTVRTDPAVLAAISPTLHTSPYSSLKMIDGKITRELATLPGGPLSMAVGGEVRWEDAENPAVPYTNTAEIVGLGYSQFAAKRRIEAAYAEVQAPVFKWLELGAAVRHDKYSDVGGTTNPKIDFKIKPIDQFAIRGTYSEAFRAPGPAETGGSSFGFTSVGILSQGNPSIKPETAKSYTLGFIAEPLPGYSATVDYWKIDRKNEIVQADPASIIPAGSPLTGGVPNSKLPGKQPNTFIYYDADGNLSTVSGFYANANSTKTDGVDVELIGRWKLGEAGNLVGKLNWTHTRSFRRTDADGNEVEYVGTQGPIVLSAGAGTPKDRATLSLTWDRGPYAVTGALNYIGPLKMIDHVGEMADDNGNGTVTDTTNGLVYNSNGATNCAVFDLSGNPYGGCKVPSFITMDLFGRWNPAKNFEINLSIQNLFDKKAPFDPYLVNTYGINYNQTWHQAGAVGRMFTLGGKYTF